MITKKETKKWDHEYAVQNGADALVNAQQVLIDASKELGRYIHAYRNECGRDDHTHKDQIASLTQAINYLATGVLNNCRMDLMAAAAVRISETV